MSELETRRRNVMSTLANGPFDLAELDLVEIWSKADESERARFTWAVNADTGSETSALAFVELAPGGAIPWHFDHAGEIDVVLAGVVKVERDDGAMTAHAGAVFQVSAGTRHRIANASAETARLALFFDRPSHRVTFDEPLMPMDDKALGY
jgi:quercetin dioxygenase-like cupin family protein